ncbi:MAG TPA: phosphoribosylamine--glycine ligase [Lentimicrobium sp.]|nr:phosphoribosylamine--glycine ligase [Lentimicrobium sp.]
MNILILGSGGREHALAWKFSKSPQLTNLYIAPGNAGTSQLGMNVDINPNNFIQVRSFCFENSIDLLVIGPEEPLVNGIYDYFKNDPDLKHISVLGPSKAGAQLEGSKDFAKKFMLEFNIPSAPYKTFNAGNFDSAIEFIKSMDPPYVLKADGLAAGKGVIILNDEQDAIHILEDMLLNKKFGIASEKVVIEKFLKGIELSMFVLTDGKEWILLPEAKDYKRVGVNDTGPNTGGMGSVSPVPFADKNFIEKVKNRIIQPTIDGLKQRGIDYKGFIFFGLMNVKGDPFVIEYNVRMGDPETESVIPRIKDDLITLIKTCADGQLSANSITIDSRSAVTVMLVSGGYPGDYQKGYVINGIDQVHSGLIFHAGTKLDTEKRIITSGGRVIAVTSMAESVHDALKTSFDIAQQIDFKGKYYRSDIGFDLLR